MEPDLERMLDGSARCDFCGSDEPRYLYPANSYEGTSPVDGKPFGSSGAWAACSICKQVVDQNSLDALVDHALAEFLMKRPGMEDKLGERGIKRLRREAATIYRGFLKNRTGEPVAFG